jgi:hypothetical protein
VARLMKFLMLYHRGHTEDLSRMGHKVQVNHRRKAEGCGNARCVNDLHLYLGS